MWCSMNFLPAFQVANLAGQLQEASLGKSVEFGAMPWCRGAKLSTDFRRFGFQKQTCMS